jgi:hypothetical protein
LIEEGQVAMQKVNMKIQNALHPTSHNGAFIGVAGTFKHSQNGKTSKNRKRSSNSQARVEVKSQAMSQSALV